MSPDYPAIEASLLRELTEGGERDGRHEAPPPVPDHTLVRRIGGGSYGEVWLARNVVGTYRAVKLVYRRRFGSARPYEREFQGMQCYEPISRRHEGLVDVLQIGRNDEAGFFYYVMELADDAGGGPPLAAPTEEGGRSKGAAGSRPAAGPADAVRPAAEPVLCPEAYRPRTLSSEIRRTGRLPAGDCVQAFLTLTAALSTLHRCGLLHRDLKPSNIVIVGGMPKLADIGLVAEAGAEMTFVGTEGFIPPEGPGTAAADLFALGRMFYEAFTGLDRLQYPSIPASPGNMAEVKAMLELSAVAEKACAPDPRKRYQSAEEMLADLALLHSGRSVQRLRTVESRLRKARTFGLVAAAAAVLAAGAVVLVQQQRRKEERARADLAGALAEARLQRAIAERVAGSPGARFAVLEALAEAARTRPGDPELRSAAITALAQPDLRERRVFPADVRHHSAVCWNASGTLVAVARQDGAVRVERPGEAPVAILRRPGPGPGGPPDPEIPPLYPVLLDDSGRHLMTWDTAARRLWDIGQGRIVWELPLEQGTARIDAGGGRMCIVEAGGRCLVRDIKSGAEREVCRIADWPPAETALSEFGGDRIALAQERGRKVLLVDLAGGGIVRQWEVPGGEALYGLSLSQDGQKVRVGTAEASIFVLDAREPDQVVSSTLPTGAVLCGAFSPDGEAFVSSGWDGVTRLFETATCRLLTTLPNGSFGTSFPPDGRRFFRSDGATGALHEYDFAGTVCRVRMEPPGRRGLGSPTFPTLSPDGTLLATGSWQGARLLHTSDGSLAATLPGRNPIRCVVFRADGNLLTGSFNGLKFWPSELDNGGIRFTGEPRYLDSDSHDIVHSDAAGRVILSASMSHLVRSVDGGPFEPLTAPAGTPPATPPGISLVSPDGRWIASSSAAAFRIWKVDGGALHWQPAHDWQCVPVFSPDGRRIAANDRARVWVADIESRRVLWQTPQPEGAGVHGAWSPDGRWLVMARRPDSLTAFNAETGEAWGRIQHPDARATSGVVFSRDGGQLIVTTATGVIQMWQIGALREGLRECGLDFPLPR